MGKPISPTKLIQLISFAEKHYPNAKSINITTRYDKGGWMYVLSLKLNGEEIRHEIAM